MPAIAVNKKATFDYQILESYEAGLVLHGQEVKSIKAGHISLKEAYVEIMKGSKCEPALFLVKAHVSPYKPAGPLPDYNPTRPRQLLLKTREVSHLIGKRQTGNLTLVPLKIYTKQGLIKLEFALAQGRKKYDKREVIKKREVERQLRTLTKRR